MPRVPVIDDPGGELGHLLDLAVKGPAMQTVLGLLGIEHDQFEDGLFLLVVRGLLQGLDVLVPQVLAQQGLRTFLFLG